MQKYRIVEKLISPKISIWSFFDSDPNLTLTQILTLKYKTNPNPTIAQTLTQTLILTLTNFR